MGADERLRVVLVVREARNAQLERLPPVLVACERSELRVHAAARWTDRGGREHRVAAQLEALAREIGLGADRPVDGVDPPGDVLGSRERVGEQR